MDWVTDDIKELSILLGVKSRFLGKRSYFLEIYAEATCHDVCFKIIQQKITCKT